MRHYSGTSSGTTTIVVEPPSNSEVRPSAGTITNVTSTATTITLVGSEIEHATFYEFAIKLESTTYYHTDDSSTYTYRSLIQDSSTSLNPGTEYTVNYRGMNASNDGRYTTGQTIWTLPEDPIIISATATSKSAIKVTWSPSAGATEYSFYYVASGTSSGTRESSVSYTTNSNGTLSYTITGLSEKVLYHIYLYSYNANGDVCANEAYTTSTTQSDAAGYAYIYSGGWQKATPYVWTGSSWTKVIPYIYASGSWKKTGE